jgi:vancomycin resistance protein YoaR
MAVFARSRERAIDPARRRVPWKLFLAPFLVLAVAAGLALGAQAVYAQRALPGMTVGGVGVGSLDASAIRDRLHTELAAPWAAATVTLVDGESSWRTNNADLGVAPDLDQAVAQALAFGKTGSPLDRMGAWIDALRGEASVPFAMRANGDALDRWVSAAARDVDRVAVSGELRIAAGGLEATRPVLGREVDRVATTAALLSADSLGDREIALRVRTVYPAVDASGFDEAYARASAAVTPLTITVEDRTHEESAAGLATFLVIERVAAKPGELPAIPGEAVGPAERYRYVVSLENERVAAWVTSLGQKLDHLGRSAKFQVNRDNAVTIIPSESGVRVDQEKLRALLLDELTRPASSSPRVIAAPAAVDPSAFTTAQANELLPKLAKTSSFTTYYPPSASRHANIATGAAQFDGVVILPGQVFSFWELLGPVTVERGYRFAGAIINNRSDENVIGGGLCQVSTTMFNAVSAQGYEIIERHAHGYYIDRYPIGYDAAVFDPGVDLKWRNDTANPMFLWSWSSPTSITFEVWGIPTGRTVVLSGATQRNFVSPAPDQPADPAFPKGVTVQGRDVWRTRTVYENGKVLHQQTFGSHYAPVWGGPLPAPQPPAQPQNP